MALDRKTVRHRKRWWILLLLFLAITINILDRQVLSLVAPELRDKLGLSNQQYGTIVFSFMLGMALGQIPAGLMLDRIGARRGFPLILAWWSTASLLHAAARTLAQFSGLRFLLGLGECGLYSGGAKVISQWFPPEDRAFAAGLFNSGAVAGSIVAPPLIAFLTIHYGWRTAFLIPSLAGLLWVLPWLRVYWEPWRHPALSPEEHKAAAQLALDRQITGSSTGTTALLAHRAVWGVILMRTFSGPVTHFYWYWLPEYLKRERGMSLEMIGMFAWLPFFSGGLGNIGGGWLSSRLIRNGWSVDRARKTAFALAVALCACAVWVPAAPNAAMALVLISTAAAGVNAFAANHIGLLTDLFPETILAKVTGMTGLGDGLMSMSMMLLTGIVVDRYSYLPVFLAAGVFPLVAITALFALVRTIRPLRLTEAARPE